MLTADLKARIARELYMGLERLGADPELLSIVGSWRHAERGVPSGDVVSEQHPPRNSTTVT